MKKLQELEKPKNISEVYVGEREREAEPCRMSI